MSLRIQATCVLMAVLIVFIAISYGIQKWVVMPAFADLERQQAQHNVDRCVNALRRDLESLSNNVLDWAAWDDTYRYIADRNTEYENANLVSESFDNLRINLLALLTDTGAMAWGRTVNLDSHEPLFDAGVLERLVTPTSLSSRHARCDSVRSGILRTEAGPMLLAARPIVKTDRQGPIRGTLVMGRILDDAEIPRLSAQTQVQVTISLVAADDNGGGGSLPLRNLSEASVGAATVQEADPSTITASVVLPDLYGRPALLVDTRTPRDITAQGAAAATIAAVSNVVGAVAILCVMGLALHYRVVGPLQRLSAHAVRVGRTDDLKTRLSLQTRDEIGDLAREFDGMMEQLAISRQKVLESARRAGMAEIAAEVLHNVGNAVNSAGCSCETISERLCESKISGLERAAALLSEQAANAAEFFARDPRGPKLIRYIADLAAAMKHEQTGNLNDVERLQKTLRHIRETIATQQVFAGRSNFRQEVRLSEIIDEVLRLNGELLRGAEVQVTVNTPTLPELWLNRSMMVQVLVNLVRNAVQAMQSRPQDRRQLTLAATLTGDGVLELCVHDTGVGFGDDTRARLFTHGFTTKPEGNGYGLHYCANAVQMADGSISASSPGPDQGATFLVRLPGVLTAPREVVPA